MASYLITGCSRGLGLAMVTHLTTFPQSEVGTIFATARKENPQIKALVKSFPGRVVFVQLDVTDVASIKTAVIEIEKSGKGLDVLINNAGVMPHTPGGPSAMDDLEEVLSINVLSVHNVTRNFLPLLETGNLKKIVNVSITDAHKFPWQTPAYNISKAALNMLTVQYSLSLAEQGFTIIALSPGWVRTDLGGQYADLSVEEAIPANLDRIMKAKKEDTGKFLNIHVKGWEKNEKGPNSYDGKTLPW